MKKTEILRKAFDEAIVVKCVKTGNCSVFPVDAEIEKSCEGDFGFRNEEGDFVFLTLGEDMFARSIVASISELGIYVDKREEEQRFVYKGKQWTVESFYSFIVKLTDEEREEFVRSEVEFWVEHYFHGSRLFTDGLEPIIRPLIQEVKEEDLRSVAVLWEGLLGEASQEVRRIIEGTRGLEISAAWIDEVSLLQAFKNKKLK